jgi:hypothetical protein
MNTVEDHDCNHAHGGLGGGYMFNDGPSKNGGAQAHFGIYPLMPSIEIEGLGEWNPALGYSLAPLSVYGNL